MPKPNRRYLPHAIVATLALMAIIFPAASSGRVQSIAQWFLIQFDWLTLLIASGAVIFCALIVILPIGNRRIGGPDAVTEFRLTTWFAMLFAAGMGAGLVFWGAAEPLIHTISPPPDGALAGTDQARRDALAITQFHWSLHAWSVYAVAALVVAMATPSGAILLPSQPLRPAPEGVRRVVDWVALLAVIFGVVASVGQGLMQMSAGAARLSGGEIGDTVATQIGILVVLTLGYMLSASTGLRRGIAWLSNFNLVLAGALALFVFIAADTAAILSTFWESLTAYGQQIFELSTELRPEGPARQWTREWSLTYFLWWVAWTPFVGVFIARISRGRRLRTFVLGVVLVPSIVTLAWFSIFGGAALSLEAAGNDLGVRDFRTAPAATYAVLDYLPMRQMAQTATLILVFVFILTSADSGSYVLGMFSRGRAGEPSVPERLFWGAVISVLTGAAILSAEGQSATRAFAVAGAIPLVVLLGVQALMFSARTNWFRSGSAPRNEKGRPEGRP